MPREVALERIPEPELMDDPEQARAYAEADFEQPHGQVIGLLRARFPGVDFAGPVLDLGCGPADITVRFAEAFPAARVDGVDGAEAMLAHGRARVQAAGLTARIRLIHGRLPGVRLPQTGYRALISNSLLHHLHDPMVLWESIRSQGAPGAAVFIMDLMRPADRAQAQALVAEHAGGEPQVLRRDFYNSLLAAFRPAEVEAQLSRARLGSLRVEAVSDRHLVAWGRLA